MLLTSSGLSNASIAEALFSLVGKRPAEIKVAFIPTAMNVESGDKSWFIRNLEDIRKQGFESIEIADISAVTPELWRSRIESADVIFFSGGNSFHLMRWINTSGLRDLLPELMKTKVWVGISAGSMVANPSIVLDEIIYNEDNFGQDDTGLGYVDFYIAPHINSADFPGARAETLEQFAEGKDITIYGLDDQSAVKVNGKSVEVITEGEYIKI